jgi:hypothetical protein
VQIIFSGGHETDPVDRGRPVALIAGALGVPPEVFREAFSGVRPAPPGTEPSREPVRQNKEVLMAALGPHGVTNDRLDEVSNRYRYRPGSGELWPTRPAVAHALLQDGEIIGFEIEDRGFGYNSPPHATVPGHEGIAAQGEIVFGPDFERNGAVSVITLPSR